MGCLARTMSPSRWCAQPRARQVLARHGAAPGAPAAAAPLSGQPRRRLWIVPARERPPPAAPCHWQRARGPGLVGEAALGRCAAARGAEAACSERTQHCSESAPSCGKPLPAPALELQFACEVICALAVSFYLAYAACTMQRSHLAISCSRILALCRKFVNSVSCFSGALTAGVLAVCG
jgi:hypothetical protein